MLSELPSSPNPCLRVEAKLDVNVAKKNAALAEAQKYDEFIWSQSKKPKWLKDGLRQLAMCEAGFSADANA